LGLTAMARGVCLASTLFAWGLVWDFARHSSGQPRQDLAVTAVVALLAAVVTAYNFAWGRRVMRRGPTALLVSTVLSLAVVEVCLRVFDPLGISYYSEMSRYILDRVPDPQLKYRHRRSWGSTYQGAEVRFNENGLRDDPIGPKAPGEFRILVLGDSQTFGWGVARQYIWPVQLQEMLQKRLDRPVRVIDAGVCGYDTRQEYRYLLSDGYEFAPDLVLLLFLNNDLEITDAPYDPWGDNALRGKSPSQIVRLLVRKLRLFQLPFKASDMLPALLAHDELPAFGARREYADSMRQESGWKASMAALDSMARSAEARHTAFAVVHFAWATSPFSEALDTTLVATANPFPVAYAPDWFRGQDVLVLFNSVTDNHPNPEGHRLLAQHIADFLIDRHAVPALPPSTGRPG
jgi:lysophospholipase L1-like esterase